MPLEERSYSGKFFRPRPEVLADPQDQLFLVATPWGPRSTAKKTIQVIQDHFLSSLEDQEATSPFPTLSCLSAAENNLRTSLQIANQNIYREDNRNEYTAGVELFAATLKGNELIWAQVGQPAVFLSRPNSPLVPLNTPIDMTTDFAHKKNSLHPLPQTLLGIDPSVNLTSQSVRLHLGDEILLLSRSTLPPSLFSLSESDRSVDAVSRVLAKSDSEMPFWIGKIHFESVLS